MEISVSQNFSFKDGVPTDSRCNRDDGVNEESGKRIALSVGTVQSGVGLRAKKAVQSDRSLRERRKCASRRADLLDV